MAVYGGSTEPEEPEAKLVALLRGLKEAKQTRGKLSLAQIRDLIVKDRRDRILTGERVPPMAELRKGLSDATLSGVFNGQVKNPRLVYELAIALGADRHVAMDALRWAEQIHAKPKPPPQETTDAGTDGELAAVINAVLARLPTDRSRGTVPADKDKLRLAVEIALGRATIRYAWENAMTGLAVPLLRPGGFLAEPVIAEILAAALTGRGTDPRTHGDAWARAFLAGTRIRDLTRDASEFLGYIRIEGGKLQPLRRLWPAQGPGTQDQARPTDANQPGDEAIGGGKASVKALRQAASTVRAELSDVTRMLPTGPPSGTCRRWSASTCTTRPS